MSDIKENEEFEFRLRQEQEESADATAVEQTPEESMAVVENVNSPTIMSEALKVGGRGIAGLTQGLADLGNSSIVEAMGGTPASYMEKGSKLVSQDQIKKAIQKFVMSGSTGLVDAVNNVPTDSLHDKYGFPVFEQPETAVGRALGIAANIGGSVLTGGKATGINARSVKNAIRSGSIAGIESKLNKADIKLPSTTQIQDAIKGVADAHTELVGNNLATRFETKDALDVNKIAYKIKESAQLEKLDLIKTSLSDSIAQEVQGAPNKQGLGVKASKELGKAFETEYKKFSGEKVPVDDVAEVLGTTLEQYGIIDGKGDLIPDAAINESQAKVLNLYNKFKAGEENGVIQLDLKKISLGELDKNLKSILTTGKQYGSGEHILTDLRYNMSNIVAPLRKVGAEFAPDFQLRNSVYDKFNIFNRIGFRRGVGDQTSGMGVLDNLSHKDPASVLPQNERMMDFIKRYTGKDPSEPVKAVSRKMKDIEMESKARDIKSQFMMSDLDRKIFKTERESTIKSKEMIDTLARLKVSAKLKEAKDAKISGAFDTVVKGALAATGASAAGGAIYSAVKKMS